MEIELQTIWERGNIDDYLLSLDWSLKQNYYHV